ncbi:MAG: DUF932 domain-containing protein [Thermoplasmatales archaeon]
MTLATRFGHNSVAFRQDTPLDNDQLRRIAPSIFAEHPHESRTERYGYIPTIAVLDGLRREGFQPFMVAQSRCRDEGKTEYTKHMLRLCHPGQIVGEMTPEIVLVNSHDGTSSYQMMAGIFRFVCQNGLVAGDVVEDIRVRHSGGNIRVHDVIDAAYRVVDGFDRVAGSIEGMKATPLALPEKIAFAESALALKYEDQPPITPQQVLKPRRSCDSDPNLWATFNLVQENLIKGGLEGRSASGRRTTTRPVQGIDSDIRLNKALWILADRMAELKRAN